jgi:GNAT superfamily N-acetyltransferase
VALQIRRLDATDPDAMAAWHATYHAAYVLGQDHASPWMLEEMRADFLGERAGERIEPFGGYVDERPVVTGVIELPQMDNRHIASVDVAVHPEFRRRGAGTAMLEHLTGVARANGRTTLNADAVWAYDARADGAGEGNADFLTRHGFVFSLGDAKRALDLPVDDATLDRLAQECAGTTRTT